ncbi:Mitochondrial glycoprotein [Parasponia andersonii]|uniref:Mitochondrial glycoprotein n=1 Tax=Parasponia andersonii TaxID=3476 RepID=A0A2P5ALB8_PARAD|nr:Mitochondrial glycoprotein [Parasponia andersonii]
MAAFTSIIRKSASSLAPLAYRVARSQRNHQSLVVAAINHANMSHTHALTRLVPTFHYSSESKKPSSDESLLRVIESEIQCATETDDHDGVDEVPNGFPFEIQDNPGLQTITLKRKYQGEDIQVEVHMPDLVTGEQNDDDDNGDEDSEKSVQSSIPLVVNVSKKDGPSLEFSVTAYPDEIAIEALSVKHPENSDDQIAYEGPDFHDLDENLQKSFHKYLEIRGIKPSTTNFLHEYMINKDSREYLVWLQKLKKFVEA